ncbi:hypothetical protein ABGT15_06535 [Flavobacterium enshiense]|uniref:hypothetical protein n=1 Tax=Flavobacterium enshiense TaxID=1341165 RepID=UPI00345C679F
MNFSVKLVLISAVFFTVLSCKKEVQNETATIPKEIGSNLDAVSEEAIDETWYREYYLMLEDLGVDYEIKVAQDTSYIQDRGLKDILIPVQKKDTLFLYHKKSLEFHFEGNKKAPEATIVKVGNQYFISSQLIKLDAESEQPSKYGFPEDK